MIERSSRDPQFREGFPTNPRETVEREFGVTIPQNIEVKVVEKTPSSVYVVLPPTPEQAGQQLSDADPEAVAGGGWGGMSGQACSEAPCAADTHFDLSCR